MSRLPRVVIVEDSDDDFYAFKRACKQHVQRTELVRFQDGDSVHEYLRRLRDSDEPHPQFIILDLNLPGLDGRALLTEVKSDPKLKTIPVVVYTTSDAPGDIRYCYEHNANAFHTKPVDYQEMKVALNSILDYWLDRVVPAEVQ